MKKIGILHPGQMGISVAATIVNSGYEVYWVSENRSQSTVERAKSQKLMDLQNLKTMCNTCDVIISICPPHAAESVAMQVVNCSFCGLYLDCNAIAPQRAALIGKSLSAAGIQFVDGGIIGGPAWTPGSTWLYLSGESAEAVVDLFHAGSLGTEVIGTEIGKASALKMCYAAYTKGSTALISSILAASEGLNVREILETQWSRDWPGFVDRAYERTQRVTQKAWRFEGEMTEIASTFEALGLPDGFHIAASEIYSRLAQYKDLKELPALEEVLETLLTNIRLS